VTIVEFLDAQLNEDEAAAFAATPGPWRTHQAPHRTNVVRSEAELDRIGTAGGRMDMPTFTGQTSNRSRARWEADASHIACHDPTRVLREVAATRRILAGHESDWCICQLEGGAMKGAPCSLLKNLAAHYIDRPGYKEEWRS
jgi:hypothetical protein